ncbi:MAG: ion transporter [Candidatus Nanoarchaeia archaeon]
MEEYFIEEKTVYDKVLDIAVFLSVFVVTIFLIMDVFQITNDMSVPYLWISVVVLVVFLLDLIRLRARHDTWKEFFHDCWLDILATIPFELIAFAFAMAPEQASQFAILKWIRVTRLSRAGQLSRIARTSKITKEFKAAAHLKEESDKFKEKNRV